MAEYDALPTPARRWLAQAAMPWSATSVRRAWAHALRATGCEAAAVQALSAREARLLRKDSAAIWGDGYPGA